MIALAVGCARQRCARVRQRFIREGLEGLRRDAPRSGRPAKHDAQRIVTLTTTTRPEQATDWSRALMAHAAGVSASTVGWVWRQRGLKPHRVATFKVSNDAQFTEKLEAIVGLYLAPPERALVLCVDEKSQIQALDRTQPVRPLRQGRHRTQTHDYSESGAGPRDNLGGHRTHAIGSTDRTASRLVNLIATCCVLAWRIFWMTMINRSQPPAAPSVALTQMELELLDRLKPDRAALRPPAKTLSHYLTKIARLGGYLDRASDPPPGNIVMWRGLARLSDITLGFSLHANKCG